jgi:hypothetical protein
MVSIVAGAARDRIAAECGRVCPAAARNRWLRDQPARRDAAGRCLRQ